jgi:hypothetical protein
MIADEGLDSIIKDQSEQSRNTEKIMLNELNAKNRKWSEDDFEKKAKKFKEEGSDTPLSSPTLTDTVDYSFEKSVKNTSSLDKLGQVAESSKELDKHKHAQRDLNASEISILIFFIILILSLAYYVHRRATYSYFYLVAKAIRDANKEE